VTRQNLSSHLGDQLGHRLGGRPGRVRGRRVEGLLLMSLLLIPVAAAEPAADRRSVLARWIRLLVAATITNNLIEASSRSPPAGASSTALIGFGLDSAVEVASASYARTSCSDWVADPKRPPVEPHWEACLLQPAEQPVYFSAQ
jgi:hypothetical protein